MSDPRMSDPRKVAEPDPVESAIPRDADIFASNVIAGVPEVPESIRDWAERKILSEPPACAATGETEAEAEFDGFVESVAYVRDEDMATDDEGNPVRVQKPAKVCPRKPRPKDQGPKDQGPKKGATAR